MVNEHWRLSHFAAWKWAKYFRLELEETHAECNVALIRAAELWRPDGGKTFAGYAMMLMHHHLVNYAKKACRQRPTPVLGHYWDLQADPKQPDPAEVAAKQDELQVHLAQLHAAIRKLDPRSQLVMKGRASGEVHESIARRLKVTRQRIQQIEKEARERLREMLQSN
jgi:RNA polymerase sigma factor (sigma-70 family)